jgi:hypothetical protein
MGVRRPLWSRRGLWRLAAVLSGGLNMRRMIAIAVVGASLGGCSSFSVGDYFKSTPPSIQIQLESNPPGADAKTSLGPGCKTPCSVSVPAPDTGFSVQYTLNKYQAAVVDVKVMQNSGEPPITDPSPVYAELQPAGPPPKVKGTKPKSVKKPKPAAAAATAEPAQSPFPAPNAPAATR